MTKEGLSAYSLIFNPQAIPWVRQVFPVPRVPTRRKISPARANSPIRTPSFWVCSGLWLINLRRFISILSGKSSALALSWGKVLPSCLTKIKWLSFSINQGYLTCFVYDFTDYGYRAGGRLFDFINDIGASGKQQFVVFSPR